MISSDERYTNIPQELKELRQWVCYRIEERDGKPTKIPYRTDKVGRWNAKTNDPKTWHTFEEVLEAVGKQVNKFDGIGFVLSESDPYVFIDLDHVIEDGKTEEWASELISAMDTYTELSQSGTGIHIIARAKKPGPRCRIHNHPKFEIYDNVRLVVFTGKLLSDSPAEIRDAQQAVEEIYFSVFGENQRNVPTKETFWNAQPVEISDHMLIEKAMSAANGDKFGRLWCGNTGDYNGDESSADMALCCMLVFWTQRDPVRIVKLFRESGLMRPKWDEKRGDRTYGEMTIEAAIRQTTEVYQDSASGHGKHEVTDNGEPAIRVRKWPDPLEADAFHGLAGDFVRLVGPHTEADPAALLSAFLVAFGNAIGRTAYFIAEADSHYMNLFVVQVGMSSKGRKGTSLGHIKKLFREVDGDWESYRMQSGLSSGEGLIWAVHDPIEKTEPIRENKQIVDYQSVIVDEGIRDKRLLCVEGEFASTLRVLGREGNTLSAVIRNAWDTGSLSTLTKNSPGRATGAHISIIGHITKDELLRYLDSTEAGNGFGNRFLWFCVKRSNVLPEGGQIRQEELKSLAQRLKEVEDFAQTIGEIRRDEEARSLWYQVYPELSEGKPGLLGSMIARAEAQVMRLACIYALLDRSELIRLEHLTAAIALWKYCEESARFIFGDSLGDPVADELLRALRGQSDGMTRTEISGHFGRHKSAGEIARALGTLGERGLVRQEMEAHLDGRPVERWFAVKPENISAPIREISMTATGDNSHNSLISQCDEENIPMVEDKVEQEQVKEGSVDGAFPEVSDSIPATLPYRCASCGKDVILTLEKPGMYWYRCSCPRGFGRVSADSYQKLLAYDDLKAEYE